MNDAAVELGEPNGAGGAAGPLPVPPQPAVVARKRAAKSTVPLGKGGPSAAAAAVPAGGGAVKGQPVVLRIDVATKAQARALTYSVWLLMILFILLTGIKQTHAPITTEQPTSATGPPACCSGPGGAADEVRQRCRQRQQDCGRLAALLQGGAGGLVSVLLIRCGRRG